MSCNFCVKKKSLLLLLILSGCRTRWTVSSTFCYNRELDDCCGTLWLDVRIEDLLILRPPVIRMFRDMLLRSTVKHLCNNDNNDINNNLLPQSFGRSNSFPRFNKWNVVPDKYKKEKQHRSDGYWPYGSTGSHTDQVRRHRAFWCMIFSEMQQLNTALESSRCTKLHSFLIKIPHKRTTDCSRN